MGRYRKEIAPGEYRPDEPTEAQQKEIDLILSEYTDEFLNEWLYWRPVLEGVLKVGVSVDIDDLVKMNLWLDLKNRITNVFTPKKEDYD